MILRPRGTVLRLPMVYGPGDPLHRFFPLLKRLADRRSSILLTDDLAAWRGPQDTLRAGAPIRQIRPSIFSNSATRFRQVYWVTHDIRLKKWALCRISQDFFEFGDRSMIHLPLSGSTDDYLRPNPITPLEKALEFLVQKPQVTRYCENPDCTHPYFISVRSQRYCSRTCARPAQREAKRKYWKMHRGRRAGQSNKAPRLV